jgi:hypothetical protein
MARAHRYIGWLTFAVFLASGFYLHFHAAELAKDNPSAHFTLRANHIYVLMSALLNLAFASASPASGSGARARLRTFGHILILVAPSILFAAFRYEGPRATPHLQDRPLTLVGVFTLVIGVLLIVGRARRAAEAR